MKADPKGVLTGAHFMDGDHAACEGALAAGCRFVAGYPITPSTEVVERFAARIPLVGGVFVQMEDEIASSIAILGAAWGGRRLGRVDARGRGFGSPNVGGGQGEAPGMRRGGGESRGRGLGTVAGGVGGRAREDDGSPTKWRVGEPRQRGHLGADRLRRPRRMREGTAFIATLDHERKAHRDWWTGPNNRLPTALRRY